MHFRQWKRRTVITLLGSAAAWPLAARAQQPAVPVIGFVSSSPARDSRQTVAAFHRGLNEAAFIEGQNVAIEYRWADNQHSRLP
jgi:putative ABC transport system substrate-binding protein